MASIILGIAALVGINSFGDNLARSISEQARELLGADLVLSANQPFDPKLEPAIGRAGHGAARGRFPLPRWCSSGPGRGTRLAQVRARSGGFFYGAWEVQPQAAATRFADTTAAPGALVDDALLTQFGAKIGDSVQVGNMVLPITGRVLKTPGQSGIASAVAPTVFIPTRLVAGTGLVQRGSRVKYTRSYQFAPGTDVAAVLKPLQAPPRTRPTWTPTPWPSASAALAAPLPTSPATSVWWPSWRYCWAAWAWPAP